MKEEIIIECNHHHRAKLCDECALRNKIITQSKEIEQLKKEVDGFKSDFLLQKSTTKRLVEENIQLKKQLKERDGALKDARDVLVLNTLEVTIKH